MERLIRRIGMAYDSHDELKDCVKVELNVLSLL